MTLLNAADAVYLGDREVDAIFAGVVRVWPPSVDPWGPAEHMYVPYGLPQGPADPGSFSLGNKFTVLADGRITGLRTFHLAGSGPSRSASLWTTGGVLLATTNTVAEVNGWNTALLPTPIIVSAGKQLVASFGYYGSAVDGGFSYSSVFMMDNSANLRWDAGMYSPNPSDPAGFPANPITPNHYFADVMFQASSEGMAGYGEYILSVEPLSYWRLGEASGSTTGVDQTGLHPLTYTATPTLGVSGVIEGDADTAMQTAGLTGQGGNAGNPAALQLYTDFTVEAWIKTSGAGASLRSIVVKQNAYGLFLWDNIFGVYEWSGAGWVTSGVNLADGQRHHVVAVFGVNFGAANSRLYVDGVPVGAPFTHAQLNQGGTLGIGYNDYPSQEFIGIIDEVAIYGRRLTDVEIAANHDAGVASPTTWKEP